MVARKTTKSTKSPSRKSAPKRATKPARAKADVSIHQLKVTLAYFKPSIWRRIQVRSDATLGELHAILQMAMGWSNSHMHQFVIGKRPNLRFIGSPNRADDEVANEDEVTIDQALPRAKSKLVYEYDFGDGWEHEVLVEKIGEAEKGIFYPRCVAGENACPPDDVGGVWGYAEFLEAINDPDHERHDEFTDWIGDDFDPQEFDLDAVNRRLKVRQNYVLYGRGLL